MGESRELAVGPLRSPMRTSPKSTTGPDGRFAFPPRSDKFLLIAVSDAGYADASSEEFAKSGKLVLQAWGQIEGGVRIGARIGANEQVVFHPIRPEGQVGIGDYELRLHDADRRARPLPFRPGGPWPGDRGAGRRQGVPRGPSRSMPGWQERVEIKPGETAQVTIGGKGRPVIGRVVLDGTPESPVDWTRERVGDARRATRELGSGIGSACFNSARSCSPRRSTRTASSASRMFPRASSSWSSLSTGLPTLGSRVPATRSPR